MMGLLPLCCAALLPGCSKHAARSETLYTAKPWPTATNIRTQKDVARYAVRGKAAYDSCVVNLEALKSIDLKP